MDSRRKAPRLVRTYTELRQKPRTRIFLLSQPDPLCRFDAAWPTIATRASHSHFSSFLIPLTILKPLPLPARYCNQSQVRSFSSVPKTSLIAPQSRHQLYVVPKAFWYSHFSSFPVRLPLVCRAKVLPSWPGLATKARLAVFTFSPCFLRSVRAIGPPSQRTVCSQQNPRRGVIMPTLHVAKLASCWLIEIR